MTREEAIQYWADFREEIDQFMDEYWTAEDIAEQKDATDMAIAALREQPQWISVEERMPDDSFLEKEIIICVLNRFGERKVYTKKFWGVNSALWNNDTTHWMPLPEPPKEEV